MTGGDYNNNNFITAEVFYFLFMSFNNNYYIHRRENYSLSFVEV